jgi:hypothetical protein
MQADHLVVSVSQEYVGANIIYLAKAEKSGPLVAESTTTWLGNFVDKMGKKGSREVTFNFLSADAGITLLCVECFDKLTSDAIIKEAPRANLLACYIADADSIPKIASAIRGKSVIRFRLPHGLGFNDPNSIDAHVGLVIQNLNKGLC